MKFVAKAVLNIAALAAQGGRAGNEVQLEGCFNFECRE